MALSVVATDITLPINTIYEDTFLRQARPLAVYFVGSKAGLIQ